MGKIGISRYCGGYGNLGLGCVAVDNVVDMVDCWNPRIPMPATHGHERFGLAIVRTTAQHDAQQH